MLPIIILVATLSADPQEPDLDSATLAAAFINVSDLDAASAKELRVPVKSGVVAWSILPYGPAAEAKMRDMDILVRIDDQQVSGTDDIKNLYRTLEAGKSYRLAVHRMLRPGRWSRLNLTAKAVTSRQFYLESLTGEADPVTGATIYKHRDSPQKKGKELYCYFPVKDGKPGLLRMRIQRASRDPIGIIGVVLSAGEPVAVLNAAPLDTHTDVSNGVFLDWYDAVVSEETIKALGEVGSAATSHVRLRGVGQTTDYELEDLEKKRLLVVLQAFDRFRKHANQHPGDDPFKP